MSLHYLSNDLLGQLILFLTTHYQIVFVIVLTLMVNALYFFVKAKRESDYGEGPSVAFLAAALFAFVMLPLPMEAHGAYLVSMPLISIAGHQIYYQSDYEIDTSTTYQLHEADDTHHHPTKEGWTNTATGQIKGQIDNPQGQITQVKHGEPGTDLVEITYTIGDVEHKATVHLSDKKFIKLWSFVQEKPLPLSVLDNGDFAVDPYVQPKSSQH